MLVLILDYKLVSHGSCSPFIDFLDLSLHICDKNHQFTVNKWKKGRKRANSLKNSGGNLWNLFFTTYSSAMLTSL